MKVTAIIPNHNYAEWIVKAIDSIVAQTYPCENIVVIDDVSTDESVNNILALLDEVSANEQLVTGSYKGHTIHLIKNQEQKGPGGSRNIGMAYAWNFSDVFAFLDADDEYLPTKVEKSVEILKQDPKGVGCVYSDYDTVNLTNGIITREFKEPFNRGRLVQECIVNNDSCVNKLALEKIGLYDESLRTCEDYDLWLRMSEQFILFHIPESLIKIRVTGKGASFSVSKQDWQKNWTRVMQKLRERHGQQS